MEREKKDFNSEKISRKLYEDAKTEEILYCPKCNNQLIVQRSKDWSKLYAVYCPECQFGMKVSHGLNI